jgi:putative DNA primase/helicase
VGAAIRRRARIEAMVKLARSHPDVALDPQELDADPWLLNVANGTIDLRTGRLGTTTSATSSPSSPPSPN